jgi:triosephosphate isomerase
MSKARRPLIAGNWKMNNGGQDGIDLARAIAAECRGGNAVEVVVAPPASVLHRVSDTIERAAPGRVGIAAQNVSPEPNGAFTGELSASMLLDAGCQWVIIGHSERRQLFGETDESVRAKTEAALKAGLLPIVCIGETLAERDAGRTLEVVYRQLDAFSQVINSKPGAAAIAYEPVWAIGTGRVATPDDAQEVCAAIRGWISQRHGDDIAAQIRILYGGSVNATNVAALMAEADIDGCLVGAASLKVEEFAAIARFYEMPMI